MKTYLIISQILYLICLVPWLAIWGLSFMSFDAGFSWTAFAFVLSIGIYPIAVLVCSIAAWILRNRRKRIAIVANAIPMIWIAGLVFLFIWV